MTSGVSQGSRLGPMLFLLYVNSLPGIVKSSHVATIPYDTKVFKSIKSPTDAALSQDDLSSLATWSYSSGLLFNESKCMATNYPETQSCVLHEPHQRDPSWHYQRRKGPWSHLGQAILEQTGVRPVRKVQQDVGVCET